MIIEIIMVYCIHKTNLSKTLFATQINITFQINHRFVNNQIAIDYGYCELIYLKYTVE